MSQTALAVLLAPALLAPALLGSAQAAEPSIPHELYQLDNGLTVILHPDDTLPQVVIDVWYGVASKDEPPGRTGFAHLFEHLMFMGTTRLPGSGFDDRMEAAGGWNNAWTSEDETNYYSVGGAGMVDLLLWMEADRMDGLDDAMTQEKLDLQREVVRNERRQSVEDSPYGIAWVELPQALYPEGHPYAHSVIGSHEDLQAATVEDVKSFFRTWYVPGNARLVVAGDFDVDTVKQRIQEYFGGIPASPVPERTVPEPVDLPAKPLVEVTDQVQLPATYLSWHTAPVLTDDDAVMDVLATIMSTGRSSRLYDRLVHSDELVNEIGAYQMSQKLGSVFIVMAYANPDVDLETVEATIQEELARLAADGPTEDELTRAKNALETDYIGGLEGLRSRATDLARYHYLTGDPDYLAEDLARYDRVTADDIAAAAAALTPERRQTLRVHVADPDAAEAAEPGQEN